VEVREMDTTQGKGKMINDALNAIKIVADCIKEAKQIPYGNLYALLMPYGMDIGHYNYCIELLKEAKVIKEQYHELFWIAE
jgi:hypothetical protein